MDASDIDRRRDNQRHSGALGRMAAMTHAPSADRRIPELDGIRALAIWMVLLAHALFGFTNPSGALASVPAPVLQILGHGWLGVDLFFLLSGFLITGILINSKKRPDYFRNFYIRRVLRIMPLYFTCIIVWSFFYAHSESYFILSSVFGANLSYLFHIPEPHGPGVLWSLAVEEHFYLVWPLVVLLLSRRHLLLTSASIFVAMPILRGVFASRGMNPDVIYMLSWFRFDGLAAGAMMAIWASSSYFSARSGNRIAVTLAVMTIGLSLAGAKFGLFGTHTIAAVALRYTQAYLAFGALFMLVISHQGAAWTSPLRWRFMQLTGAISYCLYLVHLSVGDGYEYLLNSSGVDAVSRFGPSGAVLVRALVMIAVSFAIAVVSRRYLEEPFLALKDRFSRRRNVRLSAPAGTEPAGS
jgi:peptidoglycan/LPS O-acetylase OafA/YrhL